MTLTDHQQERRIAQKADKLLERVRNSEQRGDGPEEETETYDLNAVGVVLVSHLAKALVDVEDLHDRILDLEGRSGEKPDRTPVTLR
jgi:hypothetical protein